MAPHGKELSEDLRRRIVALHEDGQGYKKIANTLKLSCSTVAKIIQHFKRAGSTQNRSRVGRLKKLSVASKCFLWKIGVGVPSALLQRLKSGGVRPYATLYIELVCMAVTPGGSLFWRQYTRKPTNSLLKTCQQSTLITGTMSYEMKINLFGSDGFKRVWRQPGEEYKDKCVIPTVKHGVGNVMVWGCRCWRVIFHWGKHELQHVLWNTAAEHDPLPPETGSRGSVPAWQWPRTHLQDDYCFTKEAEDKGDELAKHVSSPFVGRGLAFNGYILRGK